MSYRTTFNWEYCECGCHQHELSIARRHFTHYNDLKGNHYLGVDSHNAVIYGEKFSSFEALDGKVREILQADLNDLSATLLKKLPEIHTYTFEVTIFGKGVNEQEAWKDAIQKLSQNSNVPFKATLKSK